MQFQFQRFVFLTGEFPAAAILFLILPLFGVTNTRFRLNVVPEHVLGSFTIGPDILAGDSTGVAPQTLVHIENHPHLLHDLHESASVGSLKSSLS